MGSTVTDRIAGVSTSVAIKAPVKAITQGNITLSGLGVQGGGSWTESLTAGDRVLVKDQTDATENGVYTAFTSEWRRATDFNGYRDVVKGTSVPLESTGDRYRVISDNPILIGTSEINFQLHPQDARVIPATSRTAMKAYNVPPGTQFNLEEGRRSGTFVFISGDKSANITSDPQEGIWFGPDSDPTGASGAFMRRYNGLAGGKLSAGWFGTKSEAGFDNYTALQATIDYAKSSGIKGLEVGQGEFEYGTALDFSGGGLTFIGVDDASTVTGSGSRNCLLVWTGGATAMKECSTSGLVFKGFAVENRGSATDWLELNSGSINNRYEDLYFVNTPTHTRFTRSVIRSNGNRMGYSYFHHIIANSPAPSFIDIDGQGTSNGITPFSISGRCLFGANTDDFTVIKIVGETVENIAIYNNTFNQFGNDLVIVDTSETPNPTAINVLSFYDNEIDTIGDNAAYRYFKLSNVDNFQFDNNTVNAGGSKPYLGELVNTNVVSVSGNSVKSLGTAFFDADDDCAIKARSNPGSNRPVADNRNVLIEQESQVTSVQIDCTSFDYSRHEIVELDLTSGSGYTINVDASSPQVINAGQVFTLVVRNVSGGAVASGAFGSTINSTAAPVAPADGFSRSYTFYWNGTKAVEIYRSSADVANA